MTLWWISLSLLRSSALVGALAAAMVTGCGIMRPPGPGVPPSTPAPAPVPLPPAVPPTLRLDAARFADLEGWTQTDPKGALQAFLRSCAALATRPDDAPLGGLSYAGTALEWRQVC